MDITTSTSVKNITSRSVLNEYNEIRRFLKNESFKSFISWKGRTCNIKNIEMFKAVVLKAMVPSQSLAQFYEKLKKLNIKVSGNEEKIKFIFPTKEKKTKKNISEEDLELRELQEIEEKQKLLYKTIAKAQAKLDCALQINSILKMELKRSEEYQKCIIEKHVDRINLEEFEEKYIDNRET